ncbi:YccF domain-containing protein [Geodermatophilus marinus]|uniref:YccF domain-containing protein n=1 Tax=Geodermatophilus sp. LHW52908 TaxID=2303986 RepID=UPI000E3B9E77|nr:YccF domain-containing protein [Geodermatophilus sp. LHW52908]RFU19869.1 YccF domain-containing protein [Geodermatophilus sp. LHW52908]
MDTLRLLLNLVWLVLQGWILALAYAVAGLIACLLVVTIPFGIAAFRLASFVLWPFGRTTVPVPGAGVASAVGNLLWFLVAGWWLALIHIVAGIGFCLTIIGIPFGVASFKLAAVGLFPLGKRVVETAPPRDWVHAGSGVVAGAPAGSAYRY